MGVCSAADVRAEGAAVKPVRPAPVRAEGDAQALVALHLVIVGRRQFQGGGPGVRALKADHGRERPGPGKRNTRVEVAARLQCQCLEVGRGDARAGEYQRNVDALAGGKRTAQAYREFGVFPRARPSLGDSA